MKKTTGLEEVINLYSLRGFKYELFFKNGKNVLFVWHQKIWSSEITKSTFYFDANGKEILKNKSWSI
jgi:hypothetical protein